MSRAWASDGVPVAFYDLGGSGPPLLLAHATGFHGRTWGPVAHFLAADFHCFGFDERGHGDTPRPTDGAFEWQGFARDALAVIDALGLDHPFGVGHSAGGVALLLAEMDRRGAFRALYCYEPVVPAGDTEPSPGNALAAGARRRRQVFASRDEAYQSYSSKPPLDVLHPAALRSYVDYGFEDLPDGTVGLKCRGEDEGRIYEMAGLDLAYARLRDVTCPVTLACGERGTFGPRSMGWMASRVADGRSVILPSLGHFGPLESPEVVAASIRAALLRPE